MCDPIPGFDNWKLDTPERFDPTPEPCRVCGELTEDGEVCAACAEEADEVDDDE